MKGKIFITLLIWGVVYGRSGFGYTIGSCLGGEFTLPNENNYVEWIDYNSFFNGSLDYIKNDLIFSIGGRIINGNLMVNGEQENYDNELWSRFISFGYYDLLQDIEVIENFKIFDFLKFSSSIIYSIDRYGWLTKKTTRSTGISLTAKFVSNGIWVPFLSYEIYKGSYTSHFAFGISLFLGTDD